MPEEIDELKSFIKSARKLRACIGHKLHCDRVKRGARCDCGAAREQAITTAEFDRTLEQLEGKLHQPG